MGNRKFIETTDVSNSQCISRREPVRVISIVSMLLFSAFLLLPLVEGGLWLLFWTKLDISSALSKPIHILQGLLL